MKLNYYFLVMLLGLSGCDSSDGEPSIFGDDDNSSSSIDNDVNINNNVFGDPVFYGDNFLLEPGEMDYHQHEFDASVAYPFRTYDEALAKEQEFISELQLTLDGIYLQMDSRYAEYTQGITSDDVDRYESDLEFFAGYEPGNGDAIDDGDFIYDVIGGGELEIRFDDSRIYFGRSGGVVDNYGVEWSLTIGDDRSSIRVLCYRKFAHTLAVCSRLSSTENSALPHNTEYALLQAAIVNMRQIRTGIIE